nr:unnamed protein product [Digitaria exilis]
MAGGEGEGAEAGAGASEITLEYTPTWIVASVCSVIVVISLLFERLLHRLGKRLLKTNKKTQYEALLKIQKELMLLGFISLMLGVFQSATQKICVKESVMRHLLPCPLQSSGNASAKYGAAMFTGMVGGARRLLSGEGAVDDYCLRKGKVPILSLEALHQLDIFIFNLAVTHVVLSLLTFVVGVAQTKNWRRWEEKIQQSDHNGPQMIKHVQEFKFVRDHFKGHGIYWRIFGWMRSFFKQFYGSVTEEDYTAMRLGFIAKHCRGNPKFNFYNYMIRAFEVDYKKVVGISFILMQLVSLGFANDILTTECSWYSSNRINNFVSKLIIIDHWWYVYTWLSLAPFIVAYGYKSCIVGKHAHAIARLVLSIASRILCGYSTLPLYVIVSHY